MPDAANTPILNEALLDFAAAPGRHALRMGEPAVLFDAMDTLAQWALGRLPAHTPEPERLRAAALLFITRACFAMGNSHYQLLGLRPHEATPERLRARYRALIGLTHPDRAIAGLPPDAAGMINRAHEVLANARQRAEYDIELAKKARPPMTGQPGVRASGTAPMRAASKRKTSSGQAGPATAGAGESSLAGSAAGSAAGAGVGPSMASMARGLAQRSTLAMGSGYRTGQHGPHVVPGWWHRWSPSTVRVCLASVVLLACALGVLLWGLRGSGPERRLVVAGHTDPMVKTSTATDETVQLRLPAAWARGLDLPLSQVQMEDAPPGAAVPGALGSGSARGQTPLNPPGTPQTRNERALPDGATTPGAKSSSSAPPTSNAAAAAPASITPPATASATAAAPVPAPAAASTATAPTRASPPPLAASGTSAAVAAGSAGSGGSPFVGSGAAPPMSPASSPGSGASSVAPALATTAAPSGAAARPNKPSERPPATDNALAHSAIIWDVDQVRSRAYLKELLNQLQKPEQARNTNQYLQGMKVNGSLLKPSAQAMRVQRADLIETHQPGVLLVQGVLKAEIESANRQALALRFEVQAEFRGTHQGTVLTLLNMKELP
jgi:hypothetical protein